MVEINILGEEPDGAGKGWRERTEDSELSSFIGEDMVKDGSGWTESERLAVTAADAAPDSDKPQIPEYQEGGADESVEKAAEVHLSSGESDDEIPYEESAHVGVMHGDQIERVEIEEMQREIERLKNDLEVAQRALEEAAVKAQENFELAQRKQAEFINFRNRMRQENETNRKRAVEGLVEDLLPVLDSLQKAVYSIPDEDKSSPWSDGLLRTFHLFVNSLGKYFVTVVSESGVSFDPERHSAMLVVDDDEHPDNTVLEVYQNGYLVADRLLRPAMVKVGRNTGAAKSKAGMPAPESQPAPEPEIEAAAKPDAAQEAPERAGEMTASAGSAGDTEAVYELGISESGAESEDAGEKRIKSLDDIIED